MAEFLQSISQAIVDGYKGVEGFFVGGWERLLDFFLNTLGLQAFWETITNVKL